MILASEAVLPLGITAVFASGGGHDTEHAHWGYYMIAAVAVQVRGWCLDTGIVCCFVLLACRRYPRTHERLVLAAVSSSSRGNCFAASRGTPDGQCAKTVTIEAALSPCCINALHYAGVDRDVAGQSTRSKAVQLFVASPGEDCLFGRFPAETDSHSPRSFVGDKAFGPGGATGYQSNPSSVFDIFADQLCNIESRIESNVGIPSPELSYVPQNANPRSTSTSTFGLGDSRTWPVWCSATGDWSSSRVPTTSSFRLATGWTLR